MRCEWQNQTVVLPVGRMKTVSDGAALYDGWENFSKEKMLR